MEGLRLTELVRADDTASGTEQSVPLGRSAATSRVRRRRRLDVTPVLMLLPAVAIFVGVQLFPMIYSARLSLYRWDGLSPMRWVGLDNYKNLVRAGSPFHDLFVQALRNNIELALYVTVGVVLVAAPLAAAMNEAPRALRTVFRTSLLLPMVTTGIALFYTWTAIFGASGPVIRFFGSVHLGALAPQGGWFSDTGLALVGLAIVMIWSGVPYATLFYLSGLQSIDRSLYEAARVDGASLWQRFRQITWPLLWPITTIVAVLNFVYVMQSYEMVYLITNGGPSYATNTLGLLAFNFAFGQNTSGAAQFGMAAATTWLVVVGLALVAVAVAVLRRLTGLGLPVAIRRRRRRILLEQLQGSAGR